MSAMACSRGSSGLALVVLLATLALGPWLVRAPRARADVCDAPVVSTGCQIASGGADAVDDAVEATGGAVVDASRWAVRRVKTAVSWSVEHAGPVLRTLAVAGIAVGVWVGCSRVLKALSAAGGAALAAPETGGAGTAGGALAGAAAAGLACKALRAGGTLILKTGKRVLRSGGALSKIAKLAAGATGLAAVVYGTQHAAGWVLTNLLDIDGRSGRELGDAWVAQLRSDLNGVAGALLVLLAITGLGFAALRGSVVETRQVLGGLVGAAVLIGLVGSLVYALVVWTDAITNGLVHSHWGQRALGNWRDLGDAYGETTAAGHSASSLLSSADPAAPANGTPLDDGSGAPWILRLLITVLTVFFGVLVWVELQIREGALLLLVVFSGLAFASFAWPRHRGLAHGFAMLIAGVVVAKLVIVTTLLVGGSLTQTAAAGDSGAGMVKGMLTGVGLMGLAAFAGWWTVSWFGLHGAGAVGQMGGTIRGVGVGWSSGGGKDDKGDDAPPRPPAAGEGAARELAMDAAARLPDPHAAPGEPAAAPTAGGERVRQAREREQRHAAGDPRPDPAHGPARSTPGADGGHHGAETDRATLGADRDNRAQDATPDAWSTEAGGEGNHRQGIDGAAAADAPGDGGHDASGSGRAGEPSTALAAAGEFPTRPGTADAGIEPRPSMQTGDAGAGHAPSPRPPVSGGSASVEAVARSVGWPAESSGGALESVDGPVDVEGVQRAFGEHAATADDYVRGRGGRR
ncbi:MAG TPA: hypothetical protein VFY45_03210 [Baekduia sp.]|nr:hypothetical protein [Baekduia sp.]